MCFLANALFTEHRKSHEPVLYFCFQLGLEENTTLKITVNDWTFHKSRWGEDRARAHGLPAHVGCLLTRSLLAVLS